MTIIGDQEVAVLRAKANAQKTGASPAAAARQARADSLYSELKAKLELGLDQVTSGVSNNSLLLGIGSFIGIGEYAENQKRTLAELDKLGKQIEDWNTTKRSWATAGKDAADLPYSWSEWERVGKVLGEGIVGLVKVEIDYSLWNNQVSSVQEWTADTVRGAGEVLETAVKKGADAFNALKPVLIGVGVLVALGVAGYAVRAFR